jgi:hypothetical protein
MATIRLDQSAWSSYADRMSKALIGMPAEVEVASLNFGVQRAAAWIPLLGILYDPRNDILAVTFEGLDHMVRHPQTIYVQEDAGQVQSIEVIGSDGTRHIIRLRQPIPVPA